MHIAIQPAAALALEEARAAGSAGAAVADAVLGRCVPVVATFYFLQFTTADYPVDKGKYKIISLSFSAEFIPQIKSNTQTTQTV